jgi:hypothetical protein
LQERVNFGGRVQDAQLRHDRLEKYLEKGQSLATQNYAFFSEKSIKFIETYVLAYNLEC